MIGPFIDHPENPIMKPSEGFTSKAIYNPTVIKEGRRFYMLFRGEEGDGLTGKIGLAKSDDGIHFYCHPSPVIVPSEEFDRSGCEDPRVVKFNDTYFLTYVGNSQGYNLSNICLATSRDLINWKKHGPILKAGVKGWESGQIKAGAILPEKIDGRYIMYFMGEERPWEGSIGIAFSEDLLNWYEPEDDPILTPRRGHFDSLGLEPGPTPVILEDGILLIYNGWGMDCIYRPGAVVFSKERPSRVITRTDEPILYPSKDYGKEFGTGNHAVAEGIVVDRERWLLYYGGADRVICLAVYEQKKD